MRSPRRSLGEATLATYKGLMWTLQGRGHFMAPPKCYQAHSGSEPLTVQVLRQALISLNGPPDMAGKPRPAVGSRNGETARVADHKILGWAESEMVFPDERTPWSNGESYAICFQNSVLGRRVM